MIERVEHRVKGFTVDSASPASLKTLVYRSKATRPLSEADLERILELARARNLELGVTGVLLFTDGRFTQYLEGPAEGIDEVLGYIKSSALHTEIEVLSSKQVEQRQYPDWSMAYFTSGALGVAPLPADAPARDLGGEATPS